MFKKQTGPCVRRLLLSVSVTYVVQTLQLTGVTTKGIVNDFCETNFVYIADSWVWSCYYQQFVVITNKELFPAKFANWLWIKPITYVSLPYLLWQLSLLLFRRKWKLTLHCCNQICINNFPLESVSNNFTIYSVPYFIFFYLSFMPLIAVSRN